MQKKNVFINIYGHPHNLEKQDKGIHSKMQGANKPLLNINSLLTRQIPKLRIQIHILNHKCVI